MKRAAAIAMLLLTAGCGRRSGLLSDAAAPTPDVAGAEVPADTVVEAAAETASFDASTDTAVPADVVASTDAAVDASADAGADASADVVAPDPVCDAGAASGAWQVLGAPFGASDAGAWAPALALGEGGQPVVAWLQGTQVLTRAWSEPGCVGAWHDLGPAVDGSAPALASDPRGVIRAYLRSDKSRLVVERWNGSAFVGIGDPLDAQGVPDVAYAPAVVAAADGNPAVVWGGNTGPLQRTARVARWSGTAWQALTELPGVTGSYVYSSIYVTPFSLALTSDGTPLVSWPGLGRKTNVAKHGGGTAWTNVGMQLETYMSATELSGPVVRVNQAGALFVATLIYEQALSAPHAAVFRFDDTAGEWKQLGSGPRTGAGGRDYDLAIDDTGAPVLVSTELGFNNKPASVFLYRWSGTAWEALTPPPPVSATVNSRAARLVIDPHGRRVTAWTETLNDVSGVIRVARSAP